MRNFLVVELLKNRVDVTNVAADLLGDFLRRFASKTILYDFFNVKFRNVLSSATNAVLLRELPDVLMFNADRLGNSPQWNAMLSEDFL